MLATITLLSGGPYTLFGQNLSSGSIQVDLPLIQIGRFKLSANEAESYRNLKILLDSGAVSFQIDADLTTIDHLLDSLVAQDLILSSDITQSTWYVDTLTGSDLAEGNTAETALRTLAELQRRFEGRRLLVNTEIVLKGNFESTLYLGCITEGDITITVRGTTTVVEEGAISTWTPFNASTSQKSEMGSTGVDWAPHIQRRIRMVSGPALDTVAWVLTNAGAGVARPSYFTASVLAGTNIDPAVGDSFVVETLDSSLLRIEVGKSVCGTVWVRDLTMGQAGKLPRSGGEVIFFGCQVVGLTGNMYGSYGLRLLGCSNITNLFLGATGRAYVFGHAAFANLYYRACISGQISRATFQGKSLVLDTGSRISVVGHCGFFDVAGAQVVLLQNGSLNVHTSLFWGTNITATNGFKLEQYSLLGYTTKSTLGGAVNDLMIGGEAKSWADVPFTAANGSKVVTMA